MVSGSPQPEQYSSYKLFSGCIFSSQALLLLIRNLVGYELTRVLSTISLATASLCLLGWIFFFNKERRKRKQLYLVTAGIPLIATG